MWVAKLSFDGTKGFIGPLTKKYKVNLFGFPLSYFYKKDWIIVNITGIIIGNNKKFVSELTKHSRVLDFEINGDFFIGTIKEPIFAKGIYNEKIIHLAPALIDENGLETINISSFNKKELVKVLDALKTKYEVKMHYFEQRKVKNISIIHENPELTDKQKKALHLAIKNGYYKYPRQIGLEKLAKLMKVSYSTYQAHLRKAEQKLIPFFFER
ncbi:MAG: helix-turn-helix domain-containing protein [archaeon]